MYSPIYIYIYNTVSCCTSSYLMFSLILQLHTVKDILKQAGELMKQKVNRVDNWLKSTVKKEEFYRRQAQEARQKEIKAFSMQ